MAEFQPFDLGRVMQTAESIKGMRRQGTLDRLQEQYMGQKLQAGQEEMQRADRAEQVVLGKERAQQAVAKTGQILQQQNPKNYVEQFEPGLIQEIAKQGVDWATLDDNGVKAVVGALQNRANQELGVAPLESQEVAGATVLTQGGQYKNSFRPTTAGSRLKAVVGPDGKPVLKPESEAAGMTPYYKPAAGMKIQADGEGGFTLYQGDDVGGLDLGKSAQTDLQKGAINAQAGIDRLRGIREGFDPKWLSYKEQAKQYVTSVKAKAQGLPFVSKLSQQEESDLSAFSRFKSDTLDNLNRYITEITGAAMGVEEAKRIVSTMPSMEDDPSSFQSKMDRVEERMKLVLARSIYTQKKGIKFDAMPVEQMKTLMNQRGDELYKQYLGVTNDQNAAKAATLDALQSEFYQ